MLWQLQSLLSNVSWVIATLIEERFEEIPVDKHGKQKHGKQKPQVSHKFLLSLDVSILETNVLSHNYLTIYILCFNECLLSIYGCI